MHREKWGMKRKHLGHVQAACDLVKCPLQRCLPAATDTAAADTDPGWRFSLQNISCFLEKCSVSVERSLSTFSLNAFSRDMLVQQEC